MNADGTEPATGEFRNINIRLTEEQIDDLLRAKPRVVVASAGPISFDVSVKDAINKKIKVTVLLAGIPVGDVELDEHSLEQSIGPNIGIAKAFITLAVNWDEQRVTYVAKACVRNWRWKWKCADYSGTLTTW